MRLFFVGLFLLLSACQLKPTSALEESAEVFGVRAVLMDTRTALDYISYHVPGSANLLVEDFLRLQNPLAKPRNQKRFFDPNLPSVVERLAARGISPDRKVILIGYKKDSVENKKWKWLLNNLEVSDVTLYSFDQIRKIKNGRFAEVESQPAWTLKSGFEVQKEFILNKAQKCFVRYYVKDSWPEDYCR